MADETIEKPTETTTTAPDTSPEKTKPIVKDEVVPLGKFKELEERYSNLEASLNALSKTMPAPQPRASNQVATPTDRVSIIAQRLNAEADQLRQWDPFMSTYFEELARPYVHAMGALADKLEALEARVEIPDYNKYGAEIEKERGARLARGEYLAPREAYELARSRHIPEMLEEERKRAVESLRAQDQAAIQTSEVTGGTIQKSGPDPTKANALTRESFDRLSPEEKERALENVQF